MISQNLLEILSKLLSQNNIEKPKNVEPNFDSSFFSLPNYEQNISSQNAPQKNFVGQEQNNNDAIIKTLIELLPSIMPLFQQKKEETKKREEIPSYISGLHKIND